MIIWPITNLLAWVASCASALRLDCTNAIEISSEIRVQDGIVGIKIVAGYVKTGGEHLSETPFKKGTYGT